MWYKNVGIVGTTFFRFVTKYAFDRQKDGQTAFSWLERVACKHCMQRGKMVRFLAHSVDTKQYGLKTVHCLTSFNARKQSEIRPAANKE